MAPRFNPENLTLDLSVADLLDAPLLRSLGFSSRGGYERLWLGQAIHGRYQEQRLADDPSYRREVVLSHSFPHRGWKVTVQGRADGLRKEPDGSLVVEEIKSVRRGGVLPPHVRETYQRQALLYAWMLARSQEIPVRAELVLIAIGSDETERESLEPNLEALEAGIQRRVGGIVRSWEMERQRSAERRAAAERLRFPYSGIRPGQELILAAVETAVANREHLLLQAATGIGKTVAALYPALRYALANDKQLFVLTAKNTQQEMATAVLRLLNPDGAFHSLRLRAKARMCANDQIICHEEYCRFAKDYGLKLATTGLLPGSTSPTPPSSRTTSSAPPAKPRSAPSRSAWSCRTACQVTVCDYNYVFDPYVSLTSFGADEDLSDVILVIDEVHNLVDRGRGYYSPELSSNAARRAGETVGALGRAHPLPHRDPLPQDGRPHRRHRGRRPGGRPAGRPGGGMAAPREPLLAPPLRARRRLRRLPGAPARDPQLPAGRSLRGPLLRLPPLPERPDGLRLGLQPRGGVPQGRRPPQDSLQRPQPLSGRHHQAHPRHRRPLRHPLAARVLHRPPGLRGRPHGLRRDPQPLPGGEPPRGDRLQRVHHLARAAPNYERIAERLATFAETVPGNCLALFPSYAFLAEITGRLRLRTKRVLIQRQADNEAERDLLLQALRSAVLGDILLVAVAGGVFAEGVDYPGEVLKAVAVVGPCLPAVTLEQELLKNYYEERFDKGFEYSFVVPGMTRVVQAAGRLIRSPHDTGVIALFDQRFLRVPYRDYLPADWLPEEGAGALVGNPAEVAEEFFRALSLKR